MVSCVLACGGMLFGTLYAESRMSYLDQWNAMPAEEAAAAVLPCCASRAWAAGLVKRRPLATVPELLAASDSAWWSVSAADWDAAFAAHPRLGERQAVAASPQSLLWSRSEQSAIETEEVLRSHIAENNRVYEERFGRVFLLRAAGRSAAEVVAIQEQRLRNTAEAELQEAAEQQREIAHLRLQRWLGEHESAALGADPA